MLCCRILQAPRAGSSSEAMASPCTGLRGLGTDLLMLQVSSNSLFSLAR